MNCISDVSILVGTACKILAGGTGDHGRCSTAGGSPVGMCFLFSRVAHSFGSCTVPQILILQIPQNFPKSNLHISHRITV